MPDPIATSVGTKILDFILNPIIARITVVRKCNENVENLKNQVERLKTEMEHVKNYKMDVGRRGEVIDGTVQTWLTKADVFIKSAEETVRVGDEFAKKECFFRLCPNPIPRYKLSKEAEKNSQDIVDHLEVAPRFGTLPLCHAPPPREDVAAFVEGFEEFPSRKEVLDQIMEALRSPTVNKVGVYGASGVGKTMLVKMVKENAKQDSLFTVVVMATVTKDRDLKSIQEDIARDLGMDQLPIGERTDRQVADLIRDKLINVKKFLVILDDVWETEIDFEKLGIPSASQLEKTNKGSSSGQEDMLCKVLITSRYRDVLSGVMDEKDRLFEVRELKDDEACQLFKKIVGSNVESSDFQPIAKEIVEKCLGLPVAIASVGKAMKGKSQQHQWVTALVDLRKPTPEGIAAGVYKPIELSYKYLQGDELKQTFMLCSLLGHDSSINDLLKYGMGLNLFRNVKTTEETRAKVLTLVLSLKQSSLLVDGHSNMHFGMHDQIREIALSIAAREHGVLALVDEDVGKEWPEEETMEKLKWIYLSNGYPAELTSNGLKCPRLTFFHLSNKGCSLAAPTDLFTGTKGLKVLCLTKIDFQSIHSQIPLIPTKLHTLLLDRCVFRVKELGSIVANLESLEVLSLAGCDIEELPREIEKLSKLKLLDVSDCTKLKVVPPQVLIRLSELEELKMGNSFDRWDDVEEGNARLAELTELHKLTALEVRISNFQEAWFFKNLERFKIFIGIVKEDGWDEYRTNIFNWHLYSWDSYSWEGSFESSKIMKVKLQGASINDSIKRLLKKTEELYLEGLNGVENLVYELNDEDDEGFKHLKCLHVQNAPDISHIFNRAGSFVPSHEFRNLEVLTLFNLEKMKKICDGLTGAATFKGLKKITVVDCHQLKSLFSFSMARQLQRLQEIEVDDCNSIEQIIDDVEEQGNGNDIVEESEGCKLGNSVRSLILDGLPKLIGFNSNCSDISLFNDKVVFPNLEELRLFSIKINQLCVENPQETLNFKRLKRLQVLNCSSLEYLLTLSMVSGLGQLQHLYVSSCEDLKQVIMVKGVEEAVNTELIFPQLKFISLDSCSKLSSFYAGSNTLRFPFLEEITVITCPKMVRFASKFSSIREKETTAGKSEETLIKEEPAIFIGPFFCDEVVFPNLKELKLFSIKINQLCVDNPQETLNFKRLKRLQVTYCSSSEYLLTLSTVSGLGQLQDLNVSYCKDLKQVIMVKGVEEAVNTELIFPQLKFISLESCSKLSSFYAGSNTLRFPLLEKITVKNCPKIVRFASKFSSIREKETTAGKSEEMLIMEEPDIFIGPFFCDEIVFSNLETLELYEIKINQLWTTSSCVENPQEILNFKGLKRLQISECSSSEYLFTPSMVSGLVQLKDLYVSSCKDLKQVIMAEGVKEAVNGELIFPQLNSISLRDCNKLSSFYAGSGSYALKFQSVIKIEIWDCPNMITFVSTFSTEKKKETAYQKIDQGQLQKNEPNICSQTLFDDMVVIPVLDGLSLQRICVQQIWPNQITPMSSFVQKLRKLTLWYCNNLKYLFTSLMVKIFEQLEELQIKYCKKMQVVILIEEPIEKERTSQTMFPKPDSTERHDFAKSGNTDVKYGIMFSQLKSLELKNLPKLSSYSTGKCDLEFPSLKEVIVIECPQMKYFSMGRTVTKELQTVQWIEDKEKGHWVGDLNSTIQDLFTQKVSYLESGNLWLSKFPELIEIWKINPEKLSSLFQNLRHLKVCNCNNLSYLLTPNMALAFVQLEDLEIKYCAAMEQVIMVTRFEDVVETGLTCPRLKSILLESCSKLSSFYVGSNTLRFPLLEEITVKNCPKMVRFTSKFSSIQEKGTIDGKSEEMLVKEEPDIFIGPFFCDEIVFPNLEKLGLFRIKINQLWTTSSCVENPQEISNFKGLKHLTIIKCSSLEYLFTPSMISGLGQLKDLYVAFCDDLKQVIMAGGVEEAVNTEFIFPQLNSIWLHCCDKLSSFYAGSGSYALKFQSAIKIGIEMCPNMITFVSTFSTEKEKEKETAYQKIDQGHLQKNESNICSQTLFSDMVVIPFLDDLYLRSICVQQIWHNQITLMSSFIQKLRKLTLENCNNLKYLFTSLMVKIFEQLEVLLIRDCKEMQAVILIEEQIEKERPSQTMFSKSDSTERHDFAKSGNTDVKDGIMFSQLKSLELENLPKLSSYSTGKCDLEFPSLKEVIVTGCPQMKYFSMGKTVTKGLLNVQWNNYEEQGHWVGDLNSTIQDIFTQKVGCLEVGNFRLSKFPELIEIWKMNPEKLSLLFQNLRHLEVCNCNNLSYLLTPNMALVFVQLEDLEIKDCAAMEQVIMVTGFEEVVETGLTFPQLKSILLESCSKLSSFHVGSNALRFPLLEKITVKNCPKMVRFTSKFSSIQEKETTDGKGEEMLVKEEPDIFIGPFFCDMVEFPKLELLKLTSINIHQIWPNEISKNSSSVQNLSELEELVVEGCGNLKYLLTSSMIKSFEQLTKLQICDCKMMEKVILIEESGEEERMSEIFFPRLHYLKLKELPILTRFCSGNFLEFSSLTNFQMSNCPMFEDTENGVNAYAPYLFDEKIKIPIWKTLTLSSINIRQIWNSQLSSISSFAQHLTKLKVVNCCNLKYLLTFSMVKSFAQLEELMISECEIMEVVILIEGMAEEERIYRSMFPQLKTLVLNDLPQLATFCSNCDSLGEISESERVNFGIGSQELLATESTSIETKATKVVFSPVTWLALRLLPKFKYFFPQTHITEWPLLECLVVIECHEVQIVASEFSSIEMTHGDNQLERESQPLMFWISKATFPSLKHLAGKWNDNLKIWCGHHPEEYFGLEVLTLIGFPKQSAFPPPFFFESLPNLKELVVKDAFLSEIFQCGEATAKEKPVYGHTSLSKLTLSKLHELTHLWKEESQLEADILNNLRSLKVQECSRLKNLVPSTVHFDNLQTLVVSECHGLVNLMRYSTAKTLRQLKRMKVANCEMMEEIVICFGDAVKDDGIVFPNLRCLQLKGLLRLESFCSGNCNFKFPALHEAIVTECPNMQIFSKGELSTPYLCEVKLKGDIYEDMDEDIEKKIDDILHGDQDDEDNEFENESCWEGDLNSTVQHLFEEKSARNSKKSNGENIDRDEFLIKILKKAFGTYFQKDIVNGAEDG